MSKDEFSPKIEYLVNRYGRRLHAASFTVNGTPHKDELQLTREIWKELSRDEREKLSEAIKADKAKGDSRILDQLPDQTPYLMRLTYKALKDVADNRYQLGGELSG